MARRLAWILCILSATACGPKPIEYGVLLWSYGDFPYDTSDIIPIIKESNISDSFLVRKTVGKDLLEIVRWRVETFTTEKEADAYAQSYSQWRNVYAFSERRDLPVREKDEQEAKIVAKLKENQVVKVLERGETKRQEGIYDNYWYKILTETGTLGYCFGEYLVVFESQGDALVEAREIQSEDELLDTVMNVNWRPESFQNMIDTGIIDLSLLRPEFGLFPLPEAKKVELKLQEGREHEFLYESIEKIGENTYLFRGTDLRIKVVHKGMISVTHSEDGRLITETYVQLRPDIQTAIEEEISRRDDIYESFIEATFTSQAYGVLDFLEDHRFEWDKLGRLAPLFGSTEDSGQGYVGFPYYIGEGLTDEFDGVISFYFETNGGTREVNFLYKFTGGGVNFVSLEPKQIKYSVVEERGVTSLVLYFTVHQE